MTELNILCDPSVIARFRCKVKENPVTGCHEWQAGRSGGYGTFWVTGYRCGNILAHRYAYIVHHGRMLADEILLMHTCDNPSCVNPEHLVEGTMLENNRDKARKGRNANTKLAPSDVMRIYELRDQGYTCAQLCRMFGMSDPGMRRVYTGKTWPELFTAYQQARQKGEG